MVMANVCRGFVYQLMLFFAHFNATVEVVKKICHAVFKASLPLGENFDIFYTSVLGELKSLL